MVSVINNISKQTNLLGINASLEAARAGHAGKGFNIVANEVRKPSSGSEMAAKSISEILNDIKINRTNISKGLEGISEAAKYQAKATEDYSEMIDQLNETSKNMDKFTKSL